MITIILYGTEDPGNIGAVCRLMNNFEVDNLLLIKPSCEPMHMDAIKRAKHGKRILENAHLVEESVLDQFQILVGTSARDGDKNNVRRVADTPRECMEKLLPKNSANHIGIIFGPESTGLPNHIIDKCDQLVRVPTNIKHSSLNLSHAVGTLLYESYIQQQPEKELNMCNPEIKHKILGVVATILDTKKIPQSTKDRQVVFWRRILGSSVLSQKEAEMLFGFLNNV